MFPKVSGIYMIRNLKSGKCYIGQSQNINSRVRDHLSQLRNNRHYNPHLQNAWNKYDEKDFEISVLELCGVDVLNSREIYYIKLYDSFKNGYNRTEGGDGIRGLIFGETAKAKMSEHHYDCSGSKNPRAKRVVLLNTGEVFDCILDAANKYNVAKADISGNARHNAHSAGEYNGERLVWEYEENYRELSNDDISWLIYKAQNCKRGKLCGHNKAVVCLDTGMTFDSIREAAEYYNVSPSVIGAACRGKQIHAAKDHITGEPLTWMYSDECICQAKIAS